MHNSLVATGTLVLMAALSSFALVAQAQQKTLAATMEVYVFPRAGQAADVQSQDEAACYDFAVQQTGTDPWQLAEQTQQQTAAARQQQQQTAQATEGAAVKSAARGAATGALIGAIADDRAGQGAAWGAGVSAVRGRRRASRANQEAASQADQQIAQAQQSEASGMENFRNAFAVCLEAKDYMVRF
jgi:pyruvate/2-oxoglutarate dehydrogenase complex dihydrolipoamide acyltransferase (E2) component